MQRLYEGFRQQPTATLVIINCLILSLRGNEAILIVIVSLGGNETTSN
jgi:hypothetical protein